MKFTKMQGLGNDYIYINGFEEQVKDPSRLAVKMSDRHFGVGSDGLIIIGPSDKADFRMDMYNSDGTESEMCGNGIRCVAKYVYEHGLTSKSELTIETLSGVRHMKLKIDNWLVAEVAVDMGHPILKPELIPADFEGDSVIARELTVGDVKYSVTCLSLGNPHAVVFTDDLEGLDLKSIGPAFENHEKFPKRINASFVKVTGKDTIIMRSWERGAGETLANGTGACAAAVACVLNGLTDNEVTVKLDGGDLLVRWDRDEDTVFMTGPADVVFDGEWHEEM